MNTLWEHTCYLAKHSFDSLSGIVDQKVFLWFMGLFGITFSSNHQINVFCISTYLFIVVIGICTIAIKSATFRQIKKHIFHSIDIMKAFWERCKLNRYSINSCYYLNRVSIEIFSERSFIPRNFLPLIILDQQMRIFSQVAIGKLSIIYSDVMFNF